MSKLSERLPARTVAVIAALALAVVSVVALNDYVKGAEKEAVDGAGLVQVWVPTQTVPYGLLTEQLLTRVNQDPNSDFASIRQVAYPKDLLPENALTSLDKLPSYVIVDVAVNQVLLSTMFANEAPPRGFEVPAGQVAVSIDVEVTSAVANFLDPDDHINILVTLDGATVETPAGPVTSGSATRHLLQDVRILSIGRRVTAGATSYRDQVARDDGLLTLTLALDSADAERLIFAQSSGSIYITLLPSLVDDFRPVTTPGRNAENLFNR